MQAFKRKHMHDLMIVIGLIYMIAGYFFIFYI